MLCKYRFILFFFVLVIVDGEDPPPVTANPESSWFGSMFSRSPAPSPSPPPPVVETSKTESSWYSRLFSSSASTDPNSPSTVETAETAVQDGIKNVEETVVDDSKSTFNSLTSMIVPPGTPVRANESYFDQTISYINTPPGTEVDPNTVFGLYDVLSQLVVSTPDGGVTMKVPTSEMLEKIKPWIDPYVDIDPLITAMKGYEAYCKTKDTVNKVGDKIGDTAGNVKDGVVSAASTVGNGVKNILHFR